jgi:hypothetical protein
VKDAAHVEEAARTWGVGSGFGDTWLRFGSISETQRLFSKTPDSSLQPLWRRIDTAWLLSPHIEGTGTVKIALDAYEAADRDNSIVETIEVFIREGVFRHYERVKGFFNRRSLLKLNGLSD